MRKTGAESIIKSLEVTDAGGVKQRATKGSEDEFQEVNHDFADHTYHSPTYCSICSGLLAGLFLQGLQCKGCGMNVHRGEGQNDHDDCKLEALLTQCSMKWMSEEKRVGLKETIKQVHDLVQKSPTILKEVHQQMDRDVKAHAKRAIVAAGIEDERSKKLRRTKANIQWAVTCMDDIEERGEKAALMFLLRIQLIFAGVAAICTLIMIAIALSPRQGGFLAMTTWRPAGSHGATVVCAINGTLLLLALIAQRGSCIFRRKARIYTHFLQEVFLLNAEQDLGISLTDAARRAQIWSERAVKTTAGSFVSGALFWHFVQPPPSLGSDETAPGFFLGCAGTLLGTILSCTATVGLVFWASFYLVSSTDLEKSPSSPTSTNSEPPNEDAKDSMAGCYMKREVTEGTVGTAPWRQWGDLKGH
eukprot:GHVN01025055.1.p1 GENE.GHVN01025055.1~~GHVN01025055.1.p1  ORF type:complete len:417 (-),score=42.62 GHVN01025055.1:171-1421(-)